MNVPEELRYTPDHEWARMEAGGKVRVGITDYAQDALGDVVYVRLPEPGAQLEAAAAVGEVESTKSVSDLFSPLAGVVMEVNAELSDAPERLNDDPYGEGWIFVMEPSDPSLFAGLLDSEGYRRLIAG